MSSPTRGLTTMDMPKRCLWNFRKVLTSRYFRSPGFKIEEEKLLKMKFGKMAVLRGRNFAKEFPKFKAYFERHRKIRDKIAYLRAKGALTGDESSPSDLKRDEVSDSKNSCAHDFPGKPDIKIEVPEPDRWSTAEQMGKPECIHFVPAVGWSGSGQMHEAQGVVLQPASMDSGCASACLEPSVGGQRATEKQEHDVESQPASMDSGCANTCLEPSVS